jgi:hypothetical protein
MKEPIEEAKELVNDMLFKIDCNCQNRLTYEVAKQCAIIACEKLILAFEKLSIEESGTTRIDFGQGYWQEVKQEIINLK